MIRFFEEKDKKSIISVWREAFGDDEVFVSDFLHRFGEYMLVLEYEGKAVSMLTLFPVKTGEKSGRYVYAVATDKNYRGRGFAGRLIEYAKQFLAENNEDFLVILPQNDGLYGFYEKFGFFELKCVTRINKTAIFTEKLTFNICEIDSEEYCDLRKNYFKNRRFVEWDADMIEYFKKIYRGLCLKISDNEKIVALAFSYENGDTLSVPELLTEKNYEEILSCIRSFTKKEKVTAIKEKENGEKFGMIYPEEFSDCYFGLGMS